MQNYKLTDDSSRLFLYQRRETIAVKVGNIEIGGDNPIRVQSMANTDTNDIDSSVQQAL
ncbi:MAG: flavodoxin-dependent (E)-4-hydroxy-3-methylbut-2-enyl-diphosphate synthase, partial [Paludibacteraceae bacterium]|nr:flavodoxin-dependent (E)-4-hydroxy-3-methylbut-2-enyl-diphosphate synthase [Paludibacteraceae bacterium]